MQQIERYGVIALLLVLVTVLGVSLWGGDEQAATPLVNQVPTAKTAPLANERAPRRELASTPAGITNAPRNGAVRPAVGPTASPVTNPDARGANQAQALAALQQPTPVASRSTASLMPERTALDAPARERAAAERREELVSMNTNIPAAAERVAANEQPIGGSTLVTPQRRSKPGRANETSAVRDNAPLAPQRTEPVRPAVTVPASSRVYVVRAGDTLSEIASRELGSAQRWTQIAALNPKVDPARLAVGTKLALPEGVVSASLPDVTTAAAPSSMGAHTYVVRPGDVLSAIAQRELGSARRWTEIRDLNPRIDPDRLQVGTTLRLPEGVSSPVAAASLAAADAPRRSTLGLAPQSAAGRKGRVQ